MTTEAMMSVQGRLRLLKLNDEGGPHGLEPWLSHIDAQYRKCQQENRNLRCFGGSVGPLRDELAWLSAAILAAIEEIDRFYGPQPPAER